ncbi:galactokinase [Nocardia thailandica]
MHRWMAPGRVNVIGEHTDYNDGFVLPVALGLGVECAAAVRPAGRVTLRSVQRPGPTVDLALDEIPAARERIPAWARYPLGVIQEFRDRGVALPGLDLVVDGAVPIGAGLASSAALCCAVAVAVRDLCAPTLTSLDLIAVAHAAENRYAGVPTGILDQSAAILCTPGHALFLDVRAATAPGGPGPAAWEQLPFDLAADDLVLLVADTGETHDLSDGGYARRRAECERAAAALGVAALRDVAAADLDRLADPVLRRRARHVVTENDRVREVATRLRGGGDPRIIGRLLTASHRSLRDDFEVSTPALDLAVATALTAGAYGARMVGGGFGGSALALTDAGSAEIVGERIRRRFAERGFGEPRILVVRPSGGARRVA